MGEQNPKYGQEPPSVHSTLPRHFGPGQASLDSICSLSPTVKYDLNNQDRHARLDFLNNLATGLVFMIVVVNIFITAFGVQKPVMDVAPRQ